MSERQGLLTDYLAALEALAGQSEKAGQWARARAWAERAVAADPLLEASHRTLIRVLAAGGQTAAAQRQYSTLAQLLARELNAEPSAATHALMAKVQEAVDAAPAPLRSAVHTPSFRVAPLPLLLTTFHGRETLLRDLGVLLGDPATRLVTLLGAGGVGKTRLALELARGVAWQGAEPGVAFVPMAGIAEPRLIAESIADALAPPGQALPLERITGALTAAPDASPFLLVLDNAEYQAEEVGAVAVDLLARIPRLRVLVTSQRSLGVSGENEVTLPSLELPHVRLDPSPVGKPECQSAEALENAPSVRLFLDRAQSVRPDFPRDAASLASVARICERLEGLPLAIELCAGWAQTLGTGQMLEMLARRFELLVSRRTDVPARHRTLHAAIDYGYVQLSETMQQFFLQLAVFRSGWTLGAAADVCTGGSTPRALTMLAQMRERSLIVADETPAGGGMRYRMLESLRDFASGQSTPALVQQHAEAHAAHFARFVQETAAHMRGEEDALWTARLEDEMENIRAALKHLTAGRDVEPAWTFTAAVADAWTTHGHARETRQWTARALAMEDTPLAGDLPNTAERGARLLHLRARLLTDQARAVAQLSDYADRATSAEQALAIWRELGDDGGIAECLREMAAIALHNDNFDRAQALLAEALPLARTLGDMRLAALLNDLGGFALRLQDWATASNHMTEALEICRRLGHLRGICGVLNNLGVVACRRGNYAAARTLLREAAFLQERHKMNWNGMPNQSLAEVERLDGRYVEALSRLTAAIETMVRCGDRSGLVWCMKEMGHLATASKQYALGLRLLSCAEATRTAIGLSFEPQSLRQIERERAAGEQALGVADATAHWMLGAADDLEDLLAHAQAALAKCFH